MLTNVPGSIPSHELCLFKPVNQPEQPNICANNVGTPNAREQSFLELPPPPAMSQTSLHSGCVPPAKGHDGLEHPVINALEKLTSTTKKVPGYFPFQGWEGRQGGSRHSSRRHSGLQKRYWNVFCDDVSMSVLKTSSHFCVEDSASDLLEENRDPSFPSSRKQRE